MKIIETAVNATEHYRLYDDIVTDVEETYCLDADSTPGDIYRWCLKEHGRCTSKVYVDTDDGPIHIGWVFQKREKYDDSDETFLKETWITLADRDEIIHEREYHNIAA